MSSNRLIPFFLLLALPCLASIGAKAPKPAGVPEMRSLIKKSIAAHGFSSEESSAVRSWVVVRDADVTVGEREVEWGCECDCV